MSANAFALGASGPPLYSKFRKVPRSCLAGLHGSGLRGDVAFSMASWRSDLHSKAALLAGFQSTLFFNPIIA
jgi:hypothetical protein